MPAHPIVSWCFSTESCVLAFGHWFVWCATEPGIRWGYWLNRSADLIGFDPANQNPRYKEPRVAKYSRKIRLPGSKAESCARVTSRVVSKINISLNCVYPAAGHGRRTSQNYTLNKTFDSCRKGVYRAWLCSGSTDTHARAHTSQHTLYNDTVWIMYFL